MATLLAAALQTPACLPVSGDLILARDLAKAVPAFASVPAGTRVGYAPLPGAKRIFHAADLRREARRFHLAIEHTGEVCFEWPLSVPPQETFRKAMEEALNLPDASLEIVETSRFPAPAGKLVFERSSLSAPASADADQAVLWRGYVEYAEGRRFQIWARVHIMADVTRVVTTGPIRAGEPIQASQVRLEKLRGFPLADESAATLEQVVGQMLLRPLSADAPIPERWLERPLAVERADVVKVRVQNGPAVIVAEGRAEAGGRRGDTIPVRNLKSGTTFRARITGPGQVSLTLSGK